MAFPFALEQYIYQISISIVILLAGLGLGILVKKVLRRVFEEIGLNKIMSRVGVSNDVERIISSIVPMVIYFLTIVFILDSLGIKSIVLYLVAGAVLMLVILTLVVGLKDIIPNFIGWLYLQKHQSIREGRQIELREIVGTVERIGYVETEIKTDNGDVLYVPNYLFLKSKHRIKK